MSEPLDPPGETVPGIAVVGLAARFPGAGDAESFWRNLRGGVESIGVFSDEELIAAGIDAADLATPGYVRAKGALDGADLFDAAFFGFTPREAEVMDPQHRVFLECVWEALEDAACDPERQGRAGKRIGVWAGSGTSAYLVANLLPDPERLAALGDLQVLLLNDRDFLATRASWALDLKGPSVAVQTACSTSLVAVHMACQSLLLGECDLALAGGVAISVPLRAGYLFQEGSVASPDGHCRAFDAAAAGSVEGNGCGVVALKRLADALADGDRIHAVLRGSAINNDGAAKVGFTAPSVEGQAEVISESLLVAEVAPETIGYVEAHGSGTPLGDPVEMAALTQAFRAAGLAEDRTGFCAVGSVKTNIGHCNAAAGAAGLIKAVLALEHREIPPSLHFETPNPRLDLAASPFYVPVRAMPWETDGEPRRAGVSSFGLGGTNAHIVLEEAPAAAPGDPPARPWQLLPLSARTPAALDVAAARLAKRLEAREDMKDMGSADLAADLADIAWTLQTGRKAFEHRRVVVARDREAAIEALSRSQLTKGGDATATEEPGGGEQPGGLGLGTTAARVASGRREGQGARPVVFLFPGLGDQHAGMARDLYEAEPVFRAEVDRCAEKLAPLLGADLREVLFPAERRPEPSPAGDDGDRAAGGALSRSIEAHRGLSDRVRAERSAGNGAKGGPDLRTLLRRAGKAEAEEDPAEARLRRTLLAQPACFVVEYALARLLMSWGIIPQALLGYSIGEYVAACVGGSLPLDQALALVAHRARLIEELPAGAMLAVPLAEAEVRPLLTADLSLAATNGPHFSVVAGPEAAVAALERRLAGEGAASMRLRTTHAFHSGMMEPATSALTERARALLGAGMRPPRIPWISNVTGTWITADDLADPSYWARHMRGTVRFAEGLGELSTEPERVFLEVGPGATLGTLVRQCATGEAERVTAATMRRADEGGSDVEVLLAAVGRLWIAGVEIDWSRLHGGEKRRRVALPTYPFERQRYWIDPPRGARPGLAQAALAKSGPAPDLADWFWVPAWKRIPLTAQPPPESNGREERWLLFLDIPEVLDGRQEEGFGRDGAGDEGSGPDGASGESSGLDRTGDESFGSSGSAGETRSTGAGAALPAGSAETTDHGKAPSGLGERIAARLRARGCAVYTVVPGAGFADLGEGAYTVDPVRRADYDALLEHLRAGGGELPGHVLHLWGLTIRDPDFAAAQAVGLASLTLLAQAIAGDGGASPIRLTLAANGLAEVVEGDPVHPSKATALPALKVLRQELPRLKAHGVDVALPSAGSLGRAPAQAHGGEPWSRWMERLADQLLAEIESVGSEGAEAPALVALRGRHRFLRDFEPVRLPAGAAPASGVASEDSPLPATGGVVSAGSLHAGTTAAAASAAAHEIPATAGIRLSPGAAYLISGAADGPGMALAEHLVRRVGARVGLVLPKDFPPRARWETWVPPVGLPPAQDTTGVAVRRLLALEKEAGLDRVLLLPCDAGDAGALRAALDQVRARLGPVRGAFWTGGTFPGGLLQLATPESLRDSLEPVVRGVGALLAAVDSHAEGALRPPDASPPSHLEAAGAEPPAFAVLFSTTPAVTGGLGQVEVAAAGAYLEAVAARRAGSAAGVPTLAVHWEPYQWGGWLVAGVGGAMGGVASEEVQADLAAHGVAEERSGAALERLLASPLLPAGTAAALVSARDLPGLIAEIDSVTAEVLMGQAGHGPKAERPPLATPYEPPQGELEEKLAAIWQELFGIASIGRDDSFLELGGHSLLSIQVVTQIKRSLDVDLPVTALFEAPTVAALAAAVRRARGEAEPEEVEALLALIEGLSPEEAAMRLAELGV